MQIAVLLYDDMTALDAIGPYEAFSRLPDATVTFVAERAGLVRTDMKLGLMADAAITDVPSADIVVVPGGPGDAQVREREPVLAWLRHIHATARWTTSVCSGSLILGAAGLLKGLRATSHFTVLDTLKEYGAEPTLERVVFEPPIVTSAGVSSGIDMALRLVQRIAGDDLAQAVQLGMEYDPQPPFDCGSPEKAPPAIVDLVRAFMAEGTPPT